jgi:glycosyltransferase involved in cell wall biosynthesis
MRGSGPRRVLFVDHAAIVGGAQLSLAEHLRTLDRDRFVPLVACTDALPALLDLYRHAGAEVHVLPLPRLRQFNPLVLLRLMMSAFALRRLARALDVDLVVAGTSRAAYIAAVGLIRARIPLVWWVRDFFFNRAVFRLLAPAVTRFFCVSEAVREFYRMRGDSRFDVVVVGSTMHQALDALDEREVEAARIRLGFGDGDAVVGYMGRLVEEKGPEDLVAAMVDLHRQSVPVKLLIVGTGRGQKNDVEARMRALVAERGWSFVTFAGFQQNEALYYRLFDMLVLPTRTTEGYPMSIVQAMMAKTPVIASAVGGTPELVADRETGLLVPPSSPRRIAGAVVELIENSALRERLVRSAYAKVMKENREDVVTRYAERLYAEILAGASSARSRAPEHSITT